MFAQSMYIPHVHDNISKDFVVQILETKFQLGRVVRIESIPKVSTTDAHTYCCYYVYFDTWSSSASAVYLQSQFSQSESTKMFYNEKQYWVVCKNSSHAQYTVDQQPKHMSIVTYLPADVAVETVYQMIEYLDLGKVECIQYTSELNYNYYQEQEQQLLERTIVIHYTYWYRTQSATAFQQCMSHQQYVDIPGDNYPKIWTFYESTPITEGKNPYVWTRPDVVQT